MCGSIIALIKWIYKHMILVCTFANYSRWENGMLWLSFTNFQFSYGALERCSRMIPSYNYLRVDLRIQETTRTLAYFAFLRINNLTNVYFIFFIRLAARQNKNCQNWFSRRAVLRSNIGVSMAKLSYTVTNRCSALSPKCLHWTTCIGVSVRNRRHGIFS